MDFGKMLDVCKMPILLLIVFSLVANMLAGIEIVGIIAIVLMFLAGLLVLGWAGMLAAGKGADAMGGAMAGAFAGVAAAIVSGTLSGVIRVIMAAIFWDLEDVGIVLFWSVAGTVIGIVVMAVAGAVCGGIGASLTKPKKK